MSLEKSHQEVRATGLLVVIAAGLTLLSAVVLTAVGGSPAPRPESVFRSPIIEFELALSPAEVFAVLGNPAAESGIALRSQMDRINYADYFFMVCYSALNAVIFVYVAALNRSRLRERFSGRTFVRIGLLLAFLMLAGDAVENVALLKLTAFASPDSVPASVMNLLVVATRVKWGAIYAASILLGLSHASYFGKSVGSLVGFSYTTAGSIGLMSLIIADARPLCEWASLIAGFSWLTSSAHAASNAFRKT